MAAAEGSVKRKRTHKVIVAPTPQPQTPQVQASQPKIEISTPKSAKQADRDVVRKEEVLPSKKRKNQSASVKEEVVKVDENLVLDWPSEDLVHLIDSVGVQVPKSDTIKYNTQVEKVNWDAISFRNHTAAECRDKWKEVTSKLRRFRVLSELVADAREWIKHPWISYSNSKTKSKHPGLPKKPLTPYFRYFLEKREKYSKDNPNMSMTDLAKLLAKVFSELPDKKKQKYKDNYLNDRENYQRLMEKFKEEHPDMFPDEVKGGAKTVKRLGNTKAQGPFGLFLAEKMAKYTNLDPSERKEYEEKYREAWKCLSDHKKIKWIKKTSAYEKALEAGAALNPSETIDPKGKGRKSLLTKAERDLLDKESGKPEKPPSSGYSLYSKLLLKELKDYPTNKKMTEIARRWKEMTEKAKQDWAKKAQEASEAYKVEYATYLSSLSEEERRHLESQKKGKSTKAKAEKLANDKRVAVAAAKEKKMPKSAAVLYQQDKLPLYKARYADQTESEIKRLLIKEFSELSEKKQEKYNKMLAEMQKQNGSTAVAPVKVDPRKPQLFKGEPKKPPSSGYMLYSGEMLGKVDSKQRMAEISRRWKTLTPAEQERYKKKTLELKRKYEKDHEKFISGLSDHDRKQYDELQKAKHQASQKVKKGRAQTIKVEPAESEDEDEDDNKDSEKDDSSDDSDSDSDSSSSDGSNKSDSGSDSDSKSDNDSSSSGSDSDNTKEGSSDSSSDDDSDSSDAESSSGSDK